MKASESRAVRIASGVSPLLGWVTAAGAQESPGAAPSQVERKTIQVEVQNEAACPAGTCCPPTVAQKAFIGVGGLALALVLFFLLTRSVQSYYIRRDRPLLHGRHAGLSLSLFVTSLGLAALVYLITGCWPPESTVWVGFVGGVWLVHGIYALAVVRDK